MQVKQLTMKQTVEMKSAFKIRLSEVSPINSDTVSAAYFLPRQYIILTEDLSSWEPGHWLQLLF